MFIYLKKLSLSTHNLSRISNVCLLKRQLNGIMQRSLHSKTRALPYFPTTNLRCKDTQKDKIPLIVLLPWLNAQPKHVNKYIELYHKRGYDVMTCSVKVSNFLWPESCYSTTKVLTKELSSAEFCHRPLIFHSFSVGTYMLSVLFSQMIEDPNSYSEVSQRILGFVNDSITVGGTKRMTTGIAHGFSQSKVAQFMVSGTIDLYLAMTHRWTVRLYDIFINAFYNNPVPKAPLLYFYSHNDPMSDPESVADVINYQKLNGYDVVFKDWQLSAHAQHYVRHPKDYVDVLDRFLKRIDTNNPLLFLSKL
ncbi:hypothetical protein EB796_004854 [Bugula neritina]|uniref:TMEM53 n=1 Tax=Bugula neritina TaxID=10212 RepID=A0A7J7KGR3_BUGNE|nr:hypothetical protein EB796_004854 [Bugula neritina]